MIACAFGHLEVVQLLLKAEANPNHQKEAKLTNALMIAAKNGFSDIVQQLLEYGADPNIRDDNGYTAIHYGMMLNDRETLKSNAKMKYDKLEILQLLIVSGISVNIKDGNGMTALMKASFFEFTEAVKLLLQAGADPNIEHHIPVNEVFITSSLPKTHTIGFTALIYACINVNSEVVNLLLQSKANPNQENALALMFSALQGCPDIVQLLLEYGADPNSISDIDGFTALHYVLESYTKTPHNDDNEKKLTIIQQLLEKGANIINIQNENGLTALMMASDEGLSEVVELLLQNGADPNIRDKNGRTAIHYIMILDDRETPRPSEKMMSDKLEILQLLIVKGINVNIKDRNGATALIIASIVGFTEAVKLLLHAGADPNVASSLPTHTIAITVLIFACLQMHSEVVKLLLQAKADPNHENALALMIAAEQGYLDIVQQLLEYGADPNSISNVDGSTALHYVLKSPTETLHKADKENTSIKLTIIQQLLEKGANIINIQNKDGLTALMMATDDGLSEIVELLLQNGADPNIHGDKGLTALMCACNHGNSKVAKSLLRFNANPQLVDNDGFTASIHALHSGNKGLAYELVNDRDFSPNELKCLLIMDLLEGDLTEAISRLDDITDLTTDKKELLISCVVGSLEDVISKLHESGIHPDTSLVGGLTLLMIASSCGYIELVEYLVIMEGDINQRDIFWKYTPLFYAILGSKSNELVELLIENGADINAVAGNQTPLDMANSSPVEHLTSSLLIEHGGQTFSEMTSVKSEIQPPIKKKYAIFADFTNQVKSLIQDTVVKREHTEYELNI